MSTEEHELALNPIVPESIQHNAKTLTNTRSLTSSLFGVAAGTLRLESYAGFLFYLAGTLLVSGLVYAGPCKGQPGKYFYRQLGDLWGAEVMSGVLGFVLTWTLFYNLVAT